MSHYCSGNGDNTGSSEDEGPLNRTETSSDEEIVVEVPRPRVRSRPPPQSPGTSRKTPNFGLTLKLKKGRRARHRYVNDNIHSSICLNAKIQQIKFLLQSFWLSTKSRLRGHKSLNCARELWKKAAVIKIIDIRILTFEQF